MAIRIQQRQVMPTGQGASQTVSESMLDAPFAAQQGVSRAVGQLGQTLDAVGAMITRSDIVREQSEFAGFVNEQKRAQKQYMIENSDYQTYGEQWAGREKEIDARIGQLRYNGSRQWAKNYLTEYRPVWNGEVQQYTRRQQVETISASSLSRIEQIATADDFAAETDVENRMRVRDGQAEPLTERDYKERLIDELVDKNVAENIWDAAKGMEIKAAARKQLDAVDMQAGVNAALGVFEATGDAGEAMAALKTTEVPAHLMGQAEQNLNVRINYRQAAEAEARQKQQQAEMDLFFDTLENDPGVIDYSFVDGLGSLDEGTQQQLWEMAQAKASLRAAAAQMPYKQSDNDLVRRLKIEIAEGHPKSEADYYRMAGMGLSQGDAEALAKMAADKNSQLAAAGMAGDDGLYLEMLLDVDLNRGVTAGRLATLVTDGDEAGRKLSVEQYKTLYARLESKDKKGGDPLKDVTWQRLLSDLDGLAKDYYFAEEGERADTERKIELDTEVEARMKNTQVFSAIHKNLTEWAAAHPDATDKEKIEKYQSLIDPAAEKSFLDSKWLAVVPFAAAAFWGRKLGRAAGWIEPPPAGWERAVDAAMVNTAGASAALEAMLAAEPEATYKAPPVNYPEAVWNEEYQLWTVVRDGRLMGIASDDEE